MLNPKLLRIISCPYHVESDLDYKDGYLVCRECDRRYPVHNDIPYLLPDELKNIYGNDGVIKGDRHKWVPGKREWNPGLFTQALSLLRKKIVSDSVSKIYDLDIGCGDYARGKVNIDLYIPEPVPPNFIVASAEYLPFKSKVFESVRSSYVVEHAVEPTKFIASQVRIASKEILMVTDNSEWIGDVYFRLFHTGRLFHDEHCYRWTPEYLANLIRRIGFCGEVHCANLSPTWIVNALSCFGVIPRIGNFFYRDLIATIYVS